MTTASVACPHCGDPAVVPLPDDATAVTELHTSLRFPNRSTCEQCGEAFSYVCEGE